MYLIESTKLNNKSLYNKCALLFKKFIINYPKLKNSLSISPFKIVNGKEFEICKISYIKETNELKKMISKLRNQVYNSLSDEEQRKFGYYEEFRDKYYTFGLDEIRW